MKKIRIGCGSGGCTYERLEPAIELVKKGNIDYLVFECLAERTIADAQREKMKDPQKGYNPMLQERMELFLPLMKKYHFKIVSNMGAANPLSAVNEIKRIATELSLSKLKIAVVTGDDITSKIHSYSDYPLFESSHKLNSLNNIISANIYLGADAITQALDEGADIVITGRVADPSLFVGPILHEFPSYINDPDKIGQAILTGHLLECCAQLTGGYYADPGYKEVPNLHLLGHPIAEIIEDGTLFITKPEGSGGLVNVDICKEQLLYEIGNPAHYITPDGIADFMNVTFEQIENNIVKATGATSHGKTDTYKVNIGFMQDYIAVGEISFGGRNALSRARLCADIIEKRWKIIGIEPLEYQFSFIGYNSLYKTSISKNLLNDTPSEIRLRLSLRAHTHHQATLLIRELQCMYINGPAGSSGIASYVEPMLSIENILIPKEDILPHISYLDV